MLLGNQWLECLVSIPLIAVIPFALVTWGVRQAAPTDLRRAGALVGLIAGSVSTTGYALHCTDDSVPFVALWYGATIGLYLVIGNRARDPICGMDVDPTTTAHRIEHDGTPYHFCGARCAETFRKDPQAAIEKAARREVDRSRRAAAAEQIIDPGVAKASAKYICPMCPGVESDKPAVCPRCGMPLPQAGVRYSRSTWHAMKRCSLIPRCRKPSAQRF
jgi:YHS domain-containing protein